MTRLVVVEPLKIRHAAAHVSVSNTVVGVGVASNGGIGATLDDDNSVSSVRRARARVIDENITSLDVGRRSLILTASTSPAMSAVEAITKILCTDLFLAARVTTARTTLVQSLVATSNEALADKVSAVTTVAAIAAVLTAEVGPGRAAEIRRILAVVVGTVPPLLGISDSSVAIISGSKAAEAHESEERKSLHLTICIRLLSIDTKKRNK